MKTKYIFLLPVVAVFALSGVSLAHAQTTSSSYTFTQNLTIGSTGAGVIALQQILINDGFLTSVSAPTGYFGYGTQVALGKFQIANGIYPAAGYFGAKSRTFFNSLSASTQSASVSHSTSQAAPTDISISSPSISYINPSIVVEGNTNVLTIAGSGFQNGASVMIGGAKLTTTGNFSPNSIAVNYPSALPAGTYGVTITNPDGGTYTLPNSFTVSQPQQISAPPATNYSAPQEESNTQAAEQTQATAALEEKTNQINALTAAYNTQYDALQQQILNIKSQYYTQEADVCSGGIDEAECQGEQTNLLNAANAQIAKIQLQEQQLYLTYTEQVNAIQ